jgi:hypothetical protein
MLKLANSPLFKAGCWDVGFYDVGFFNGSVLNKKERPSVG